MEKIITRSYDKFGKEVKPDAAGNGGYHLINGEFIDSTGVLVEYVKKLWDDIVQNYDGGYWRIKE